MKSLHAGVLDDTRWPATSRLIDEFCGTRGNFLVLCDGAKHEDIHYIFARFCFGGQRHTELEREYFKGYQAVDERLPRIRKLPDSKLAPVHALPVLGGPGAGGSMLVSRVDSRARLVLHVSPVSEEEAGQPMSRISALVLVIDPDDRTNIDLERVGAVLGLTPAQSQVAVSLAQGKTIRDIAMETGRSQTTIRWHIRQIFSKQGLSRQVELVQLVTSLASIPGLRQ